MRAHRAVEDREEVAARILELDQGHPAGGVLVRRARVEERPGAVIRDAHAGVVEEEVVVVEAARDAELGDVPQLFGLKSIEHHGETRRRLLRRERARPVRSDAEDVLEGGLLVVLGEAQPGTD